MRATGLSKDAYKRALQEWLNLSVNKNVPIFLLILSRTFFLHEETFAGLPSDEDTSTSLAGLADAISGLDKDVLNEVVLQVATSEEQKSDPSVRRIKLEVLEAENKRILEEQMAREAASKKREEKEKATEKHVEQEVPEPHRVPETPLVFEEPGSDASVTAATVPASQPVIQEVGPTDVSSTETVSTAGKEEDEGKELSAREIDALSQLLDPDPVTKEREELERIKAAMKDADSKVEIVVPTESIEGEYGHLAEETSAAGTQTEAYIDYMDKDISVAVKEMDAHVEEEPQKSTQISLSTETLSEISETEKKEINSGDESLDKAIARLKSRVSSMVERIETQLSDVQGKIGDKLHFLDKDMDGILTREEMADALQQVLKRKLSFEEAMDIAALMVSSNVFLVVTTLARVPGILTIDTLWFAGREQRWRFYCAGICEMDRNPQNREATGRRERPRNR
jgi:hypothetical protein